MSEKMKKDDDAPQKSPKKLSYFLGSYQPPGFLRSWKTKCQNSQKLKKSFRLLFRGFLGFLGIVVVGILGLLVWKFIDSRRPERLVIPYQVVVPPIPQSLEEAPQPLRIQFRGSAAHLEEVGKTPGGEIRMNPPIAGVWKWEGDSVLTFQPEAHWPVGTEFDIRFSKDLFPSHVEVMNQASLRIPPLGLSLRNMEFYIDPTDSHRKILLATLVSNYPLDADSLEGKVHLELDLEASSGTLEKREYETEITLSEDGREAYFVSETLGVPVSDIPAEYRVDKGVLSAWGGPGSSKSLSSHSTIPGSSAYARVERFSLDLVPTPEEGYDQILIVETRGEISIEEITSHIRVWTLPHDRPDLPGLRGQKNYRWRSPQEVVPAVLALSEPLNLEVLPTAKEFSNMVSFRVKAEPKRSIYVEVTEGAKFFGGYYLTEDVQTIMKVPEYPKELKVLSDGALLSMSGSKRISLLSRGISRVGYQIARIRPDDVNHLVSQSSGNLTNFNFRNYRFDEENLSVSSFATQRVTPSEDSKPNYLSFDFSPYLNPDASKGLRHGLFFFKAYDQGGRSFDKRLVMVTDLGLYVKTQRDMSHEIFVQSLATGRPVSGARVEVLGKNGVTVASATTGAQGRVSLPSLEHLNRERTPVAYTVTKGEDMSFLPYQATGRYLDYSSFPVGGVRGGSDPDIVNAFLFSDRGIYRPGDEVRLGMVVKSGDWTKDLSGAVLEVGVVDSQGNEVATKRLRLSGAGFEEFRFATQEYSPTGNYTASLHLIRKRSGREIKTLLGSVDVKVEEFLPDNLNIHASFSPLSSDGWINASELKARVGVRNLFGSVASGNRVKGQVVLSPGYRQFPGYQDYDFFDPLMKDHRYDEDLGELNTDEDGMCQFPINLSQFEEASYNVTFTAEAFEKGSGRSVVHRISTMVSPLEYLVGKKADGTLRSLSRESKRVVRFLALDSQLTPRDVTDLTLRVEAIRYVSSLVRQPNGVHKYESVKTYESVLARPFGLPAEGVDFTLPTSDAGEFRVVLEDLTGREVSAFEYSVKGATNVERRLDRNAELEISLDKSDYVPGEWIEVFLKGPYSGSGLVTIEKDQVYNHVWFQSDGSATTVRIRVPEELTGNGYVNVALLRRQDSPEIFMSPLSYGAIPFSVSKDAQTNRITLDIPQEAKPGEDFTIHYTVSKPGKICVFAVDEGILQVARYSTPDPLGYFLRKQALEVRTSQILDLLLPEYSVVQSLAAMGGGGGGDFLDRNLNPFRRKNKEPVAYWSGILDATTSGGSVTYKVPGHFNGTLRVMAVAVSADALGAAEQKATIRDTFVIKALPPYAVAPGDEFEVPVTVADSRKDGGTLAPVSLSLTADSGFEILGESQFSLPLLPGEDALATFRLKALETLGEASLTFRAEDGDEASVAQESLSIRPALPYRTSLYTGIVPGGKKTTVELDRFVLPEFAQEELTLSTLPLGLAKGLHFYLKKYPYGCTEQIISATYPLLYPDLLQGLEVSQEFAERHINSTISVLQSRLKSDGALGLWTSRSFSHPDVDAYALLFLREAKEQGYFIPSRLYRLLSEKVEEFGVSGGVSHHQLISRAYSLYALTVDERVLSRDIEALRKDLDAHEKDWETGYPGLFLAACYRMLQQEREASSLIRKISNGIKGREEATYLEHLSYQAYGVKILADYFPGYLDDRATELLTRMAEIIGSGWYSTFSSNAVLMAVDAYLEALPDATEHVVDAHQLLRDENLMALGFEGGTLALANLSPEAQEIQMKNQGDVGLFYQVVRAGFDQTLPEEKIASGLEVHREFRDEEGNVVSSCSLGDRLTAVVSFRSTDGNPLSNVAVVDMLPSGFEADIAAVREGQRGWNPDYVDVREDRLVIFATAQKDVREFTYPVRAAVRGDFSIPPLFAEAMYDNGVLALEPATRISVE
ncbi:MAG: alpha-2-macroglobulin family protein [Spirochaetales bacterium]|nr:alpha-2-macroglobulin family protein [Spirochaetales bacterium]